MFGTLAVGRLPDGRLQFWMYYEDGGAGKLYTFSQTSTDPQANWLSQSNWSDYLTEFPMPPAIQGVAYDTPFYVYPDAKNGLAVGTLPDGRLELCLAGSYGIWTCVMLTNDAGSQWSPWSPLYDPLVSVGWLPRLRQTPQYQNGQFQVGTLAKLQPLLQPLPPPIKP